MPTDKHWLQDQIAQRAGTPCTVQGCGRVVEGVSPHCKAHKQRYRCKGSATHRSIIGKEIAFWRRLARYWLEGQQDHVGIRNAIEACDRLINAGQLAPFNHRTGLSTSRRVKHWFGRLKAYSLEGDYIVETWLAMYALRWWSPETFDPAKDQLHFKLQTAMKAMAIPPGRRAQQGEVTWRPSHNETIAAREAFFRTIDQRIGVLSKRAAPEVCKLHAEYMARDLPVIGSHDPFTPAAASKQ